jgi:urocanate hydratase
MTERADDPQLAALRAFIFLSSLRDDWGGALIVACGLGSGGSALSIAANISGAGCLAIDERPEVTRAAMRSGACDFVVNTVDEALRILKNEIRQRKPVSVGLTMPPAIALEELLDRGVLPELFTAFRSDEQTTAVADAARSVADRFADRFANMGALIVDFGGELAAMEGEVGSARRLEGFTRCCQLHLESFLFASAEELRDFDARLLAIVPAGDPRHRWVATAPRFFHRERPFRRVVYLKAEECGRLE